MQFDLFSMLETCDTFFRILWFNKKFKKHSIYLKYSFRFNNICWKAWGQVFIFLKEISFHSANIYLFINEPQKSNTGSKKFK